MKKTASDSEKQAVVNLLGTLTNSQFIVVTDVLKTVSTLKGSLVFIDVFFIIVAIIAVSLSFFFTIVSFVSNIKESSWEFGVLRALGLSKKQMTKVYVYEALCLVLGATVLGTIVGLVVAVISSTLFFLFTELPFFLDFPTSIFVITMVISILTAIFASKIAVDDIKDRQISSIIKSLD